MKSRPPKQESKGWMASFWILDPKVEAFCLLCFSMLRCPPHPMQSGLVMPLRSWRAIWRLEEGCQVAAGQDVSYVPFREWLPA